MTKEDYMRLPKERLAELLAERDDASQHFWIIPTIESPRLQCYEQGGTCANPFRDCINCPRQWGVVGTLTTTSNKVK